jgi:uncharacterized oligopeptide transporter (OPT) family protein
MHETISKYTDQVFNVIIIALMLGIFFPMGIWIYIVVGLIFAYLALTEKD